MKKATKQEHGIGMFFQELADVDDPEPFVARTSGERESIYRLRYDSYRLEGILPKTLDPRLAEAQFLYDQYDLGRNAFIYGVRLDGRLVSTIRLSIISAGQKDSAAYTAFSESIDPIIERGESIVDASRLAVCCDDSAVRRKLVLYTLGLTVPFAARVGADHAAIVAREGHLSFYTRCGFHLVDGPRPHYEAPVPLCLMMLNLERAKRDLLPNMPQSMLEECIFRA